MRRSADGYSLIEVVIALTIIAMIMGFIFEGVFGAARLSARLGLRAGELQRDSVAADWLRQSLVSVLPAQKRDPPSLSGQAQEITLTTAASLHARPGAPRSVTWLLTPDPVGLTLTYQADGLAWKIARSRHSEARFSYLDAEGRWVTTWAQHGPPRLIALIGFWDYPVLAHPRAREAVEQSDLLRPGGLQ